MSGSTGEGVLEGGRVLVTGAAGMLGSQLLLDAPAGFTAVGTDLRPAAEGSPPFDAVGVDLCDPQALESLLESGGPWAGVIHPAAYTAVDKAEEEVELCTRVNVLAAKVVAECAARRGIPMVLISTDFVFDGQGIEEGGRRRPYREDDPVGPLSVYGRTKLEGERAATEAHGDGLAILRTQWLYGPRGQHFPATMLRLAGEHPSLKVVSDQVGSPTSTLELSPAVWDALRLGGRGIYHAACEGECSWHGLAAATLEESGITDTPVEPCGTEAFPRPAPRPAYSVLDCSRLAGLRGRTLAPWREALRNYLAQENGSGG